MIWRYVLNDGPFLVYQRCRFAVFVSTVGLTHELLVVNYFPANFFLKQKPCKSNVSTDLHSDEPQIGR